MDRQGIKSGLIMAIHAFEGQLPAEQLKDMRELVLAGEPGVALENLCTQAFEYDFGTAAPDSRHLADIPPRRSDPSAIAGALSADRGRIRGTPGAWAVADAESSGDGRVHLHGYGRVWGD